MPIMKSSPLYTHGASSVKLQRARYEAVAVGCAAGRRREKANTKFAAAFLRGTPQHSPSLCHRPRARQARRRLPVAFVGSVVADKEHLPARPDSNLCRKLRRFV